MEVYRRAHNLMENDTPLFKVECQMVPGEFLDERFLYHEGSYSAGNKRFSQEGR